MVDSRWAIHNGALKNETQKYAVEDYRYDALGRRVWVRAQRWCDDYGLGRFESTECRSGLLRRIVWDGDQELAEVQMPWALRGRGLSTLG